MAEELCPSAEILKRHALGYLSDDESSSVDMHLETCSACSVTLAGFDAHEDTLVSQLGKGVPKPGDPEPQLSRALDRIKASESNPQLTVFEGSTGHVIGPLPTSLRDYRLLERLGTGGMGDVYKALHVKLDKVVALKVLHDERIRDSSAVARFEREIRAAGKLEHPNIVRATDAGEVDGRHFLAMEYVDGLDMAELVRRLGQLPVAEACEIVRQAAIGLEHVHHHGLVHRDIKPSNLMLTRSKPGHRSSSENSLPQNSGVVKVLDLGLALLNEANRPATGELTHSGMIIGTLDYMAPEQGTDTHNVDIRADIYSLGATLYKLIVAEAPFSGGGYDRPLRKLAAIATEGPPDLTARRRDVSPELAAVVNKMLAKSPDARYSTPTEVAAALEPFTHGSDLGALLEKATAWRRTARDMPDQPSGETILSLDSETSTSTKRADAVVSYPGVALLHVSPSFRPPVPVVAERERSFWTDVRTRAAIAAALLLLAGILVFRISTNYGELTIKSNDPNVSFKIERKGASEPFDLGDIAWDQGQKQAKIPAGSYLITLDNVNADSFQIKDAGPDGVKEITLLRGTDVVVTIEERAVHTDGAAVAASTPAAFVIRQTDGKTHSEWRTFAEAILAFNNAEAEAIEVRGNGPFSVPPLTISTKALRIRPAAGFRPEFKPAKDVSPPGVWLTTGAAAIEIEGCDWRGFAGGLFSSDASELQPWRFRNCRFIGSTPIRAYFGPSLRIENCLLSGVSSIAQLGSTTTVEFHNNVVRGNGGFGLGTGGQTLTLTDNTFVLDETLLGGGFGKETKKTHVTFERNILQSGPVVLMGGDNVKAEQIHDALEWRARDNVYHIGVDISYRVPYGSFGFYVDGAVGSGVGHVFAADFNAWKKFWDVEANENNPKADFEQGSVVAEAHFELDEFHYVNPEDVINELRTSPDDRIEPAWELLGPGEPYVKALRAEKALPPGGVRQGPPESGPIVLLRNGAEVGGFVSLDQAAQQATQSGDVIEIRTDAPISGCEIRAGESERDLTIRAAAGYRPTVLGAISGAPNVRLSLEGLDLVGVVRGQFAGLRMRNCSASLKRTEGRQTPVVAATIHAAAAPMELRNCIITGDVGFSIKSQQPLIIDNSILSHLGLNLTEGEPLTVRIHRSILWSPLEGRCLTIANGPANFEVDTTRFITSIALFKCRIFNGSIAGWKGSSNLYSVGSESWSVDESIPGLDAWRKRFHSSEEGSKAFPFDIVHDWRLMQDTPGQGAGPNGKDIGADVSLIGTKP